MANATRPLSPHLQVYRWQLTMTLSITHRATGLALAAGTLLLVWWLMAAATGPDAFEQVQGFVGSWFGLLILFGWSASLFFHLCNGIRHLVWDAGHALDIETTYRTGYMALAGTAALTVLAWIMGLVMWGHS
jgi:succinate dehydrogenase / fumarate reductase, cytochrome b subunit